MQLSAGTLTFINHLIATGKVAAMGLGGSQASGAATVNSDLDIYILTRTRIEPEIRHEIIQITTDQNHSFEVANPYWGDDDNFRTNGIWHDAIYFDTDWFFGEIDSVIKQQRAREGYTTALVFTLANLLPLYDPEDRISSWQQQIATYPDSLAEAIIAANYPVSCTIHACYRNQITRAVELDDPVAVNHRVAAFLACTFDITFAHLRMWHPGEKRQLQYLNEHRDRLPTEFVEHITDLLASTAPDRLSNLIPAVDQVVSDIALLVHRQLPARKTRDTSR